jgi:hypothetical protein
MTPPFRVPRGMSTPRRTATGWDSTVGLPLDDDGFFGRECPQADCLAFFKLHVDEYGEARAKRALSCPVCGHRGDDETFFTQDQLRRGRAGAVELAHGAIQSGINKAFGGMNRSSGGGAVSFRFTPAPPCQPRPLPTYVERQTIRTFICPTGGHRAVIYDLLAVCPYCGPATPPRAILDDNLAAMGKLLDVVEGLPAEHRAEVEAAGGTTVLTERALGGVVSAAQNFAKQLHARAEKSAPDGNPWQNVDRLRKQWQASFSTDPMAGVSGDVVATLRLGFERRHVLEHNGGVADERYVKDSGDKIRLDRRIRFDGAFVRRFMEAVTQLADTLEATAS